MELTSRKRLDIFVEEHALEQVQQILSNSGFKGWSVFEGFQGSGTRGAWHQTGVGEGRSCVIVAIGSEAACDSMLAWLAQYFSSYPGVVAVSDVNVMRQERF